MPQPDDHKPPPHKPTKTPIPWGKMLVILAITISEGTSSTILLPFIPFMIESFGVPKQKVGYDAGWITSSFYAGQFVSSFFIGTLSDYIGRKPVLLVGLLGNTITTAAFGLSPVLWWAVLSRTLNGLLNGNTGVVKTYLREITDESNQADCYSIRSAGYAFGTVLGPFLGGVLSQPTQSPWIGGFFAPDGLFAKFPFLLPCLVNAAINAFGFLAGLLFLDETRPSRLCSRRHENSLAKPKSPFERACCYFGPTWKRVRVNDADSAASSFESHQVSLPDIYDSSFQQSELLTELLPFGSSDSDDSSADLSSFADYPEDLEPGLRSSSPDSSVASKDKQEQLRAQVVKELAWDKAAQEAHQQRSCSCCCSSSWSSCCLVRGLRRARAKISSTYFGLGGHEMGLTITLYALISYISIQYSSLFPIWASSAVVDGGLAYTESNIGIIQAVGGSGMMAVQIFGYPRVDRWIGSLSVFRWSLIFWLAIAALPFSSLLADERLLVWGLTTALHTVIMCAGTCAMAAVNLLINNSAYPHAIGTVNGIAASGGAFPRLFAPLIGGMGFAWSIHSHWPFPFDYPIMFLQLGVVSLLTLACTVWLTSAINHRRAAPTEA